jgi:trehalose utilization protein
MEINFNDILSKMNDMAKMNLQFYGHLTQVLIVLAGKEILNIGLDWKTQEEKEKVYQNVIDHLAEKDIEFYIVIGDTNTTKISEKGGIERFNAIVAMGETKKGEKFGIITPYIRKNNKIAYQEEEIAKSEMIDLYIHPFKELLK